MSSNPGGETPARACPQAEACRGKGDRLGNLRRALFLNPSSLHWWARGGLSSFDHLWLFLAPLGSALISNLARIRLRADT
jgi:hypothetical protein